jgi:hypothetical protein
MILFGKRGEPSLGVWICGALHFFSFWSLAGSPAVIMAQVNQLPAYGQLSAQAGLEIPDGATAGIGGMNSSSNGSASKGPLLPHRSAGGANASHSVSATAQIIDLAAMDEAILGRKQTSSSSTEITDRFRSREAVNADKARQLLSGYRTLTDPTESIDHRDWNRTLRSLELQPPGTHSLSMSNVQHYLKKAEEAEQANRIQASRVYYRMAWEAMTPEVKQRYQQFLVDRDRWDQKRRDADQTLKRRF